jgi:hypothetical protein
MRNKRFRKLLRKVENGAKDISGFVEPPECVLGCKIQAVSVPVLHCTMEFGPRDRH